MKLSHRMQGAGADWAGTPYEFPDDWTDEVAALEAENAALQAALRDIAATLDEASLDDCERRAFAAWQMACAALANGGAT